MNKDLKTGRRISFTSDMGASEFYRRTMGLNERTPSGRVSPSSQKSGDSGAPNPRQSTESAGPTREVVLTPPPTPAGSNAPSVQAGPPLSSHGSGNITDGPASIMTAMPARQFVAVLTFMLHELRASEDYVAMRLLLSDIGKHCDNELPGSGPHDLTYSVLGDLLNVAQGKYGPGEGDPEPPGFFGRIWCWLKRGRCPND